MSNLQDRLTALTTRTRKLESRLFPATIPSSPSPLSLGERHASKERQRLQILYPSASKLRRSWCHNLSPCNAYALVDSILSADWIDLGNWGLSAVTIHRLKSLSLNTERPSIRHIMRKSWLAVYADGSLIRLDAFYLGKLFRKTTI